MRYKFVVRPEVFACELDFLKDQLRKTDELQDSYLQSMIVASTAMANDYTGRQLNRATLQGYTYFKGLIYEIHRGPVISIEKVEVVNTDQSVTELTADDYYTIEEELSIYLVLKTTEKLSAIDPTRMDGVRVTYQAGYNWDEETRFPDDVINAVATYAARMFLNPDNPVDEKNTISENLLKKYRCPII